MNKPVTSKEIGQFFTPDDVADFMVQLSSVSKDANILEPSFGDGVFLKKLQKSGYANITGYEIDESLRPILSETQANLFFQSFVSANIEDKFDLIIGNPPYIRWKNLNQELKDELSGNALWQQHFNSLCDYLYIFILKSVELLTENGELIFITPEYWINTKHALGLRNYLVRNGYFTNIIHFNETPIFDNVASSFVIFKYIKSKNNFGNSPVQISKFHSKKKLSINGLRKILNTTPDAEIETFERSQFGVNDSWLLIPNSIQKELAIYEQKCSKTDLSLFEIKQTINVLGDIADIGNGMVSGLDRAFQLPSGIALTEKERNTVIKVLKAKNLHRFYYNEVSNYIFLSDKISDEEQLKEDYPTFYTHLKLYQPELEKRYTYNKQYNYWDWVFLRSYNLFSRKQERIFVPCKERISHKNYFRFSYVPEGIYPTQDVTAIFLKPTTKENIYYILALLNSNYVFDWLRYKGVVKGNIVEFSEKPLASVPIRLINWNNKNEVTVHDKIVDLAKQFIVTKVDSLLLLINKEFEKLL